MLVLKLYGGLKLAVSLPPFFLYWGGTNFNKKNCYSNTNNKMILSSALIYGNENKTTILKAVYKQDRRLLIFVSKAIFTLFVPIHLMTSLPLQFACNFIVCF